MVELYSIEVHFDDKESCIFFRNTKKEKQIDMNRQILEDSISLREDIQIFIEEIKERLSKVVIEEPTLEEKNTYWYNRGSVNVTEKVQRYENYKGVQEWNVILENALKKFSEENVNNESGQTWSSYFSRVVYDIPDKLKWIKKLNSFKGYEIIEIPNSFDGLLEDAEKYSKCVRHDNEILEDMCLKEYLVYKGNVVIN